MSRASSPQSPQTPQQDAERLRDRIRARLCLEEKPGGQKGFTFLKDPRLDPRIVKDRDYIGDVAPNIADVDKLDRATIASTFVKMEHSRKANASKLAGRAGWNKISLTGVEHTEETFDSTNPETGEVYFERGTRTVQIYKPTNSNGSSPCVVYFHGGGLAVNEPTDLPYRSIGYLLAQQGVTVLMPSFTNSLGAPFPRGLHDCLSAVRWASRERNRLGCSSQLVVAGESTGANLALAVTLLSKRICPEIIRGVYACAPALLTAKMPSEDIPTHKEFDGYGVSIDYFAMCDKFYTLSDEDARSSLAHPCLAELGELQMMPPVVVSVNELDPFRDEGLMFYRRCLEAGCTVRAVMRCGTTHGADVLQYAVLQDVVTQTMHDISTFASSV